MYLTHGHALDATTTEAVVQELRDRAEITDALYRFGLGQDLRVRELLASALAEDAELDFAPAAAHWGGTSPLMIGRDTIVDTMLGMLTCRIDTTHAISNPRIRLAPDGGGADLTALVEVQHLSAGDHSRSALLKNLYDVRLVRDGRRWVMRTVRIDNVWFTGDPAAFFSAACD